MKRVTIKDVAKEAGVSITTVSHALSGKGILSSETRAYVQSVAKRMNYVPDLYGSNLRKKSTGNIGLFISSARGDYYGILIDSMAAACKSRGLTLNVTISDQHDVMVSHMLGGFLDGAAILSEHIDEQDTERISRAEFPVVFLDRKIYGTSTASLLFDAYGEGRIAAEYLLRLGHKRLAYIQGASHNYDSEGRTAGFYTALKEAGVSIAEEDVIYGGFDRDLAYHNMIAYLERTDMHLPDAIFAANDLSAFGCINALMAKGYRVPEDVSIIGCDDVEQSGFYRHSLTTIHTNFEKQGELIVNKLMDMIQKKEQGEVVQLESYLVERSTCRRKE